MTRLGIAAAAGALAILSFFQFPGHTWLQQDSQIYLPVLEHLHDPSVLRNDILVQQSHVAYTLYDEAALVLRFLTGLGFREVLIFQQIVTRALGIWGLYLIAQALGLSMMRAAVAAIIVSLGAVIAGPSVLTLEYEPTPRSFGVPLLYCAIGLAANRRYTWASVAGAVAFLYHFPAAAPFWALFGLILIRKRNNLRPLWQLAIATIALVSAASFQGGGPGVLERITELQEQVQRIRTAYVWISLWPSATIWHHVIVAAVGTAAYLRIRGKIPFELRVLLPGMAAIGLLSMPLSWLLLEQWKLSIAPQLQPMRWLLFVTLAMQLLSAAAAAYAAEARRWWEAALWFAAAYMPVFQSVIPNRVPWQRIAVLAALALGTALAKRYALVVALAAVVAAPVLARVENYPRLHTPELDEISKWARSATPRDAVFLFADTPRALQPGIFRSEALRAVYVDLKGGGQVNYLREFAEIWWFRWQQTLAKGFQPDDLAKYEGLGIQYVVLQAPNRLPRDAAYENGKYAVYRTGG